MLMDRSSPQYQRAACQDVVQLWNEVLPVVPSYGFAMEGLAECHHDGRGVPLGWARAQVLYEETQQEVSDLVADPKRE